MRYKSFVVTAGVAFILLLCAACKASANETATLPPTITSPSPTPTNFPPTGTPLPSLTDTPTLSATAKATQTPTRQPSPSSTPKPAPTNTPQSRSCPGAPDILLKLGDWAMVSTDPPLANKLRSQPGISAELLGAVQPGENVQVMDGPRCANSYTWWYVRSLGGLEGWTVEGDAQGYWLVHPIWAWYDLPAPIEVGGSQSYDLRELSLSADKALISNLNGGYNPLATPLPRPQTEETPAPEDPRYSDFGTAAYAAHSFYGGEGASGASLRMWVYELEDPLSRYYLNQQRGEDCTEDLRKNLDSPQMQAELLDPFCGINGGIPIHFKAGLKRIEFTGGEGLRYFIASANYQTIDHLEYFFQGLSNDGRFYILVMFRPVLHPYILESQLLEGNFGWLLAWKDGQYEAAQATYDEFNARVEALLNAGMLALFPSIELVDEIMSSIVIK